MPTISYNPRVSLNPAVHYKTAAASYDRLLDNGPLTDEKILQYQAEGKLYHTREQQIWAQQELESRRQRMLVRVRDAMDKAKKLTKLVIALQDYE